MKKLGAREPARAGVPAVTTPHGPAVILVTGAPATGKSTLAVALARRMTAALIDQDVATGALVDVIGSLIDVHDLDDPRLAALTRSARYETIARLAEDNVRAGLAVVLVAPFTTERRHLDRWRVLERRLSRSGAVPILVWLQLEPRQILARMRARAAARDVDKLRDESNLLARLDLDPPVGPHLRLNGAAPVADLADLVIAHLRL
jgi:predicted kinase